MATLSTPTFDNSLLKDMLTGTQDQPGSSVFLVPKIIASSKAC